MSTLVRLHPHRNQLTLVKVDFETGHELEANENRLDRGYTLEVRAKHQKCIICVLQMGHSPWNEMAYQPLDMASRRCF